MKIIKTNWKWKSTLTDRKITTYIVLHHADAENASAETIDRWHKNNGWAGIGYHFYVRKDGSIYEGRPINKVGAQCQGSNSISIGVCFEGDFTKETMSIEQFNAGKELLKYLRKIYPSAPFKKHSELFPTACPGMLFPFSEITYLKEEIKVEIKELTSVNDIVWELSVRNIITDKALWLKKLEEDKNVYWLARKCLKSLMEVK